MLGLVVVVVVGSPPEEGVVVSGFGGTGGKAGGKGVGQKYRTHPCFTSLTSKGQVRGQSGTTHELKSYSLQSLTRPGLQDLEHLGSRWAGPFLEAMCCMVEP